MVHATGDIFVQSRIRHPVGRQHFYVLAHCLHHSAHLFFGRRAVLLGRVVRIVYPLPDLVDYRLHYSRTANDYEPARRGSSRGVPHPLYLCSPPRVVLEIRREGEDTFHRRCGYDRVLILAHLSFPFRRTYCQFVSRWLIFSSSSLTVRLDRLLCSYRFMDACGRASPVQGSTSTKPEGPYSG